MSLKNVVCKICGNFEGNQLFRVREMMFGFKDTFTYFQCAICECLQILDPPSDITKYYPSNYYSYSTSFTETPSREVNRMVIEICDRYLSRCNVTTGSRILDVGCGAGAHVYALRESGYIHTLGIDPYIESDIEYENGALVKKCTIHDCGQEWDIIAFNHSFEHLPDPFETLQAVARLLAEDGVCLIRIPTVSSHAWRYYGTDWVQLDAPRHFFLYSLESIKMLSARSGLCMFDIFFDSTEFQFVGSEMYRRNIPLCSDTRIFSTAEINQYKSLAEQLNNEGQGDQAAFYFKRLHPTGLRAQLS